VKVLQAASDETSSSSSMNSTVQFSDRSGCQQKLREVRVFVVVVVCCCDHEASTQVLQNFC